MKRALIIGAFGQDGTYLTDLLLSKGYHVDCAGNNAWASDFNTNKILVINEHADLSHRTIVQLDIADAGKVNDLIRDGNYDEIYNLAAQSSVYESFGAPSQTLRVNTIGVLNLLNAVRMFSNKTRFYQASSSEMYGLSAQVKQNENTRIHPRSPYAVSKAAAHFLTINYREAYDLFCCCGILFNHDSPIRELRFVTRKITNTAARIAAGKTKELTLGDISARRDWGHAKDYVKAMWLMLQHDSPDDYVIATGKTHSVENWVSAVGQRIGINLLDYIDTTMALMRPTEVPALCGDATKAFEVLDWKPKYSFDDLVDEMLDYDLRLEGVL